MYALFRGTLQIAGTFPTEGECLKAALAEGLISGVQVADDSVAQILPQALAQVPAQVPAQVLPADYHIARVQEPYDPQPDWKLPREIS
jgi:hypothetical protein